MKKLLFLLLFFALTSAYCLSSKVLAQNEERITISTYYPSPYGSYRELETQRLEINYPGSSFTDTEHTPALITWPPALKVSTNNNGNNKTGAIFQNTDGGALVSELRIAEKPDVAPDPSYGDTRRYLLRGLYYSGTPLTARDTFLVRNDGNMGLGVDVTDYTELDHRKLYTYYEVHQDNVQTSPLPKNSWAGDIGIYSAVLVNAENSVSQAVGVHASAGGALSRNYGIFGEALENPSSTGYGVYGRASGNMLNYGVYGDAPAGGGSYAGYFKGDVKIEPGNNLCIGDPSECQNKWPDFMICKAEHIHAQSDPNWAVLSTAADFSPCGFVRRWNSDKLLIAMYCPTGYKAISGGANCMDYTNQTGSDNGLATSVAWAQPAVAGRSAWLVVCDNTGSGTYISGMSVTCTREAYVSQDVFHNW